MRRRTRDDVVLPPAAEAGYGAPPPAEGFGVSGEESDVPEQGSDDSSSSSPGRTPFRTPDPAEVGMQTD